MNICHLELKNEIANFQSIMHYGFDNKLIKEHLSKITKQHYEKENSINATVNNASFVGSSYQYILNSNAGKLFVISGETNDIFKVGEEVFLSINDQEVKILND